MVGLDLTEQEFDIINSRVANALTLDGIVCDSYHAKNCPTQKGYWMQVTKFEKYFSGQQLNTAIPYDNEETYEI